MNEQELKAAALEAMASPRIGADPNAPQPGQPEPQAAPQPGQPVQAAPADQPSPPSDMDNAQTKGAPVTEDDLQGAQPVVYKIKMGENDERELNENQIRGVMERYGQSQNVLQAMNPLLQVAADAMQKDPNMTPELMAKKFIEMSNQPNPQMGGNDERPNTETAPVQSADDISQQFEQWEKDNAASLPPGYKDMMQNTTGIQNQMAQMMQMMQQIMGRSQGIADASRTSAENSRAQAIEVTKQRIANNLNQAQQRLGLSDDVAQDFKMFAAERGYTMEDFIDPVLTHRLAQDFQNGLNSGEVSRLKEISQRRQAFTGTVHSQPSDGQVADAGQDKNLEAMINRRL